MANILQDSADAIITMDPDDIITSWNQGAESIFGYPANEIIGKPVEMLLSPELREARELESICRRLRAHGAVRSYQTERITKDGRRIQVIFTRTAIRDDSGNVIGSSAVVKDVTNFRSLERQLADAEHLATLGELSAGLAHEIKNPLAGIKGAIEVIRDSLPPTDKHREILGDVLHEVNRIDKIVRDLLELRQSRGRRPTVDYRPGGHGAAHRRHGSAVAPRRSSFDPSRCGNLPDPGFHRETRRSCEQVLLNLLLNAQKPLPRAGRIEVAARL